MSKKKKVISTTNTTAPVKKAVAKIQATKSRISQTNTANNVEFVFNKSNYYYMIGGLVLIALGMMLMLGGYNEDPNVFDEGLIYSHRRITLAPIVILSGLAMEIYAIFR